jgi:hypothetical protein
MSKDLTKKTPVEIDTVLSKFWQQAWQLEHSLKVAEDRLKSLKSPIEAVRRRVYGTVERTEEEIADLLKRLVAVRAESAPYEAEYLRRPWKRYYLVTNANGHVHRGTNCNTCFWSTRYAWLIELADCDEGKMVEEYGEKACTVCFPDAPAYKAFSGPGRVDAAAKAARAAEKGQRVAEKAAKAITAPDGSPLKVGGWHIATKIAARNALSSAVQDSIIYRADHPSNFPLQIEQLTAALQAAGIDTKPIVERATKKAKKIR